MNARQKAKKYKRELEDLKSMVIKPTYVYEDIRDAVTLRAESLVPSYYNQLDDETNAMFRGKLVRELAASEDFRRAVKFTTSVDEFTYGIKISAEVKVLR